MIEIVECDQGTDAWLSARAGIVTASELNAVMAKGRGGGDSKTRRSYMLRLLGEQLTGKPEETYSNAHMERGKEMEAEARDAYALIHEVEPVRVGFVRNASLIKGRVVGCSPDSLIAPRGAIEIKTKLARLQLEVLLAGAVPAEHMPQCQGALWICELDWLDFMSYWPGLRPFIARVNRDEPYIAAAKIAVADFYDELDELKKRFT